jgi:hypothetical protein
MSAGKMQGPPSSFVRLRMRASETGVSGAGRLELGTLILSLTKDGGCGLRTGRLAFRGAS